VLLGTVTQKERVYKEEADFEVNCSLDVEEFQRSSNSLDCFSFACNYVSSNMKLDQSTHGTGTEGDPPSGQLSNVTNDGQGSMGSSEVKQNERLGGNIQEIRI
jgi:hypothetical protein